MHLSSDISPSSSLILLRGVSIDFGSQFVSMRPTIVMAWVVAMIQYAYYCRNTFYDDSNDLPNARCLTAKNSTIFHAYVARSGCAGPAKSLDFRFRTLLRKCSHTLHLRQPFHKLPITSEDDAFVLRRIPINEDCLSWSRDASTTETKCPL